MENKIVIRTPFITLGQLLKELAIIQSGGMAKWYLQENTVLVDDEPETRRGRKLYPGTSVMVPNEDIFFIQAETNS